MQFGHEEQSTIWVRKIPGFSWAAFQKNVIAVLKEVGMAEGNFVTKNARSVVKEFATEMEIEIAFLLSVFSIRTASPVTSS